MTTLATSQDIARLIEQVMQSPLLPRVQQRLTKITTDERQARDQYYAQLSEGYNAEFVNGEEVQIMPAKLQHILIMRFLMALLEAFLRVHKLGLVAPEQALIVCERNDYLPDICFWRTAKSSQFVLEQSSFPPPDFIAEVLSESTAKRDRGVKFQDYAAHGVEEYWIISPHEQAVEQYVLDGSGVYQLRMKSQTGTLVSSVITGFAIPVRALFDLDENTTALQHLPGR